MIINRIIHDCTQAIVNNAYVCTSAQYHNPLTDTRHPIVEKTSVSMHEDANAMVVFGDNASGKSLICNLIEGKVRKEYEVRSMSVKNRTSKSIGRAFIFGDEGQQSTGETSVRVVKKAFGGADSCEEPSLIILDEPDLGLSTKYARAMGRYIGQETNRLKAKGIFVLIVSHNTELLKAFRDELNSPLAYFGINTDNTLEQWFDNDEEKTIDDLFALTQVARRKESAIDCAMDAKRRGR